LDICHDALFSRSEAQVHRGQGEHQIVMLKC
jgi:hypothetical protein